MLLKTNSFIFEYGIQTTCIITNVSFDIYACVAITVTFSIPILLCN